jgi:hypothetical protein
LDIAGHSYIRNPQLFQHWCLKFISKLPRMTATETLHRDLKFDTIVELITSLTMGMYHQWLEHSNPTFHTNKTSTKNWPICFITTQTPNGFSSYSAAFGGESMHKFVLVLNFKTGRSLRIIISQHSEWSSPQVCQEIMPSLNQIENQCDGKQKKTYIK